MERISKTMTYKSPVYSIIAVPLEKIEPNSYNPNSVAPPELKLLYESIKQDGYIRERKRHASSKRYKQILGSTHG